jgi:hypothetical protein
MGLMQALRLDTLITASRVFGWQLAMHMCFAFYNVEALHAVSLHLVQSVACGT